jgi:hypothetical protein
VGVTPPDGPRDHKSTRGIRRRLQKRVQAGDATAASLLMCRYAAPITLSLCQLPQSCPPEQLLPEAGSTR